MLRTRADEPMSLVIAALQFTAAVVLIVLGIAALANGRSIGIPAIVFGVLVSVPGALRLEAYVVLRRAKRTAESPQDGVMTDS